MATDPPSAMSTPLLQSSSAGSFSAAQPSRASSIKLAAASFAASFVRGLLSFRSALSVLSGPCAALLIWQFLHIQSDTAGTAVLMVGVMSWVFAWWATEAVPIAVTAMAPLFLLPFLQISSASDVSKSYMNDTIFLLIGSFILAAAVEHYELHRRMALKMLVVLGGKRMDPWLLLLGFCAGPGFVSMWIHNTAAAVMMMPVGLGVLQKAGSSLESSGDAAANLAKGGEAGASASKLAKSSNYEGDGDEEEVGSEMTDRERRRAGKQVRNFQKAVVLAIGYSATLGGMATLTGTGVNLILEGLYESSFPEADPITWLQWLMFGLPLSMAMLCFLWLLLCLWFCPRSSVPTIARSLDSSHVHQELAALGSMSFAEISVLAVFGVLVLLWLTKSIGTNIGGWGELFNDYPGNGTVSILMATTLFIIPSRRKPGERLMSWSQCKGIPWGIILLLGGGFAIADGMTDSGLSDVISTGLDFLDAAPYLLLTPVIAILTGIMTEFTSNNSTATIFVSLLAQVATSIGRHPLFLMVPAAVGAQFSYMLPIATPPNAVAFSSGYLSTLDMVTIGFILKFVGTILLSIFMPTLGAVVFKTNSS